MSEQRGDIANLSPTEKRALLARLLREKASQGKARPAVEAPTVTEVALAVEMAKRGERADVETVAPVFDMSADAVLDADIIPSGPAPSLDAEPARILLTGATGFLGAFLLHDLLHQTSADVYCLVRADSEEGGQNRLRVNLRSYHLWDERLSPRIKVILGDLARPLLGLSAPRFEQLANEIDVIYHSGAILNFFYPYEALKPANVQGTLEIIRLACRGKMKPLHHVSTPAAMPLIEYAASGVIPELQDLDDSTAIIGGYPQTKWVAEKLVMGARSRGLPVCIYRPGMITGQSVTGAANTDDFLCRLIKGCIQLRVAPDVDIVADMTPVDYVSRAIVHLSRRPDSMGKAFNLVNEDPIPWGDFLDWIRSQGYPLETVPYNVWQELLSRQAGRNGEENALALLSPLLTGTQADGPISVPDLRWDCTNSLAGLAGTTIVCPPVNGELLETYFGWFVRSGFLPAPPARNGNGHVKTSAHRIVKA